MNRVLYSKRLWLKLIFSITVVVLFPTASLSGPRYYDLEILLKNKSSVAEKSAITIQQSQQIQPSKPHSREDPVAKEPALSLQRPQQNKTPTSRTRDAIMLFGGRLTTIEWDDLFSGSGDFEGEEFTIGFNQTIIAGIASSWVFYRYKDSLSFEIEGQVVRHFRGQNHWELNIPIITRWESFPWDNIIDTSFAFGVGASYASKLPREVLKKLGKSGHWLLYAVAEIEFGLPESDWSTVFRIHHRSGVFGVVADDAGSNVFVIGLRRRF